MKDATRSNQRKRRSATILAVGAAVVLASCTQTEPLELAEMPTEARHASTAGFLPIGPHEVRMTYSWAGVDPVETVSMSGYLDLPEGYDLRNECSYDLRAEVETPSGGASIKYVKAEGEPAWRTVERGSDEPYLEHVGKWYAGDDPRLNSPLLIVPPILLDDIGGGDYWCNLRRLDQVAFLADSSTGRMQWDHYGFNQVLRAYIEAWVVKWVDEAGGGPGGRDEALSMFRSTGGPSVDGILQGCELEITKVSDTVTFTLYFIKDPGQREVYATITFTPTSDRKVEGVAGKKTYLEQLGEGGVEQDVDLDRLGELGVG